MRKDPVTRAVLDIPITRREVEQRGGVYGYQLIRQAMEEVPRPVAARFALTEARRMLRIEALHLSDQQPYIYEDRWVCTDTVPDILDVDLRAESANEWLVRNKPYSRCDLRFSALKADAYHARILATTPGEALFVMERTTWIGADPITTVRAVAAPGYLLLTQI